MLASRETERLEMAALVGSGRERRDLSWLDWSRVVGLSPDGRRVLFDESGVAGGPEYLVYLHDLHDGSTVRVGEGLGPSLTADGRFALTLSQKDRTRLRLLPLGEGKPIDLPPTSRSVPTGATRPRPRARPPAPSAICRPAAGATGSSARTCSLAGAAVPFPTA